VERIAAYISFWPGVSRSRNTLGCPIRLSESVARALLEFSTTFGWLVGKAFVNLSIRPLRSAVLVDGRDDLKANLH